MFLDRWTGNRLANVEVSAKCPWDENRRDCDWTSHDGLRVLHHVHEHGLRAAIGHVVTRDHLLRANTRSLRG